MKNRLWLIILMLLATNAMAQKVKINNEYFVLGTLDDYMGRRLDPRMNTHVDHYYKFEKPLAYYTDSLLRKDNPSAIVEISANRGGYTIVSEEIAKRLEQYYDYKDNGVKTPKHEPILYGSLKPDMFKTDEQKLSFLAGTYVRFGQDNDTAYCIRVANSRSKAQTVVQFLKDFKCPVTYELVHNIPVGHVVYFHSDKKMKAYLDKYSYLHQSILKSQMAITDSVLNAIKKRKEQKLN